MSTSVMPVYDVLAGRYGSDAAAGLLREGQNALAWIGDFVAREAIDCDFAVPGRFHAAPSPRHYERLARAVASQPEDRKSVGQGTSVSARVALGGRLFIKKQNNEQKANNN